MPPSAPRPDGQEPLRRWQRAANHDATSGAQRDLLSELSARSLSPDAVAGSPELEPRVWLHAQVDRLPLPPRLVLTLHLKGSSLDEIARRLRVSPYEVRAAWREGALKIQNFLDRS